MPRLPRAVREQQMLEVAERVFARNGYGSSSVDAIAAGAGISKPMLYTYFGSKEGLYRACMQRSQAMLLERIDLAVDAAAPPDERLWQGLLAFFTFVEEQPEAWAILAGEAAGGTGPFARDGAEVRRQVARIVGELLRQAAKAAGHEPAALDTTEPLGRALIGAAESLAGWWREHPDQSRESVAALLMNFVWMGLGDLVAGEPWRPPAVRPV